MSVELACRNIMTASLSWFYSHSLFSTAYLFGFSFGVSVSFLLGVSLGVSLGVLLGVSLGALLGALLSVS
jgi:hypothetical protein